MKRVCVFSKLIGPFIGAVITALIFLGWSTVPVVMGMRGTIVEQTPSDFTVDVTGWKLRGCEFVKDSEVGWALRDGIWREVPFEFLEDTSPNSTRPLWRQSFGLFHWSSLRPDDARVKLTVQHTCDGNVRTTDAGNWSLSR